MSFFWSPRCTSLTLLLVTLCAGCQTVPTDVFVAGEVALAEGQLTTALLRLDQVQPSHPRYADARALALAVERRLRTCQEMLTRGLVKRAEHDDEGALRYFEQALEIWPEERRAMDLIEATRFRRSSFDRGAAGPDQGVVATTQPVVAEVEPEPPAAPLFEVAPAPSSELSVPVAPTPTAKTTEPAPIVDPQPRSARVRRIPRERIAMAETLLEQGDLERALDLLEEAEPAGDDHEVERALVRVLRQRALLRYGQGQVEEAIADWVRILSILPGDAQATTFLKAARAERRRN